jgi:hypothetical protein
MTCPLCKTRKARRFCPGIGQQICAVCCGTKRLVEIRCPDNCPYLASSREHPPAVVQRQRQRDMQVVLETMADLSERQKQLLLLMLSVVRDQQDDPLRRLLDTDVADAAGALASTYETAARGVIYDHHAVTVPAERLRADFQSFIDRLAAEGARIPDRDVAMVLRAITRGAAETGRVLPGGDRAYVDLVSRIMGPAGPGGERSARGETPTAGSGLILP